MQFFPFFRLIKEYFQDIVENLIAMVRSPDHFIIPTMVLMLIILLTFRKPLEKHLKEMEKCND